VLAKGVTAGAPLLPASGPPLNATEPLVVIKPLGADQPIIASFLNGLALFILLWNVLLLIEITQTVFAVQPDLGSADERPPQQRSAP
jgi:hypothetical protein